MRGASYIPTLSVSIFNGGIRTTRMTSLRVFVQTALFTILIPGLVAVAIPQLLAKRRPYPQLPISSTTARTIGGMSLASGVLLYVHTALQFGTEGRGTPSPTDEPGELVTGGIYAYVRNPMYVGVLLVVVGQAFLLRSVAVLWWAAGCWIGFHTRVVRDEEPHLAEKHGETYERYRSTVPRWIARIRDRN